MFAHNLYNIIEVILLVMLFFIYFYYPNILFKYFQITHNIRQFQTNYLCIHSVQIYLNLYKLYATMLTN